MSTIQIEAPFHQNACLVNLQSLGADVGHAVPSRCDSNGTDEMMSASDLSSVGEELGLDLPLAGDEGNGILDLDTVLKFFATDKPDSLLSTHKHQFIRRISGTGLAPWEIHRPQKFVRELAVRHAFSGRVLDVGCGIGDNALYIARACPSARVIAVDVVPRCLDFCAAKASLRGMLGSVTFAAADMTAAGTSLAAAAAASTAVTTTTSPSSSTADTTTTPPPAAATTTTPSNATESAPAGSSTATTTSSSSSHNGLCASGSAGGSDSSEASGGLPEELRGVLFDVVLDSFTFQTLGDGDRERYAAVLRTLLRPGGVLYLSAVSEEETRTGWFRRVRAADVHTCFPRAAGWEVELCEVSCIETHPSFWEGSGKTRVYTIRRLAA
ncbi:hypothetical protein Agub_g1212 [Astrephomene gubernaculifera]|uniref:Methyltransferase domain-containing protein n=1 Tax=Astrephomene gubernaculifera TaxID=47775 RepID=A0AAD3DF45_9CHLO|nr:hypothetical protein Agub_g1212 [Astrephomene gubernaculifera]